jgi:Carboxypeptidase regulatory-like domain
MARALVFCLLGVLSGFPAFGQLDTATISGYIADQSGAVVPGASVTLTNVETSITATHVSNGSGLYVFTYVKPDHYRIIVEKAKFRQIALTDLQVNVQDLLSRNFKLQVGASEESVTVSGDLAHVNTVSGSVSTVVDQSLVGNMPLNGRSFQSLIAVTPGVVFVQSGFTNSQFSVNGQRQDANYFMVDGVSANFGIAPIFDIGLTLAGTTPGLTASGGTNGLVSVDAMQEFRIQTSTYAPEFGRTPGAQVSIVTKSGTNQVHGSVFDYLRNDVLDARNWFDVPPLPKPPLRQNDFGGTLAGPLKKNQLFFFFSYEGLRAVAAPYGIFVFLHEVGPRCSFSRIPAVHERTAASDRAAEDVPRAVESCNGGWVDVTTPLPVE